MDYKMFFSTFAIIFLAELGDKTQLTALARSATGGKWIVFVAASLALVCSTLMAVLFGSVIRKYIPEHYIKITAGTLFLIFGAITLVSAFKVEEPVKPSLSLGTPAPWVYKLAASFEESAVKDYENLAQKATGPLKELFTTLAHEERSHLLQLREGDLHEEAILDKELFSQLFHTVSEGDKPLISQAIEHERATANFYNEIARQASIPGIKRMFTNLAVEEESHVKRLESLV